MCCGWRGGGRLGRGCRTGREEKRVGVGVRENERVSISSSSPLHLTTPTNLHPLVHLSPPTHPCSVVLEVDEPYEG
jgi:hypothetical protein